MKESKKKFRTKAHSGFTLPRRGFLQRTALVSGAFLTGVLRLQKPQASESEDDEYANVPGFYYRECCTLLSSHDPGCTPDKCNGSNGGTAYSLFWTCPKNGVIWVCVECYNKKHGKTGAELFGSCRHTSLRNSLGINCSRAVHPSSPDYANY